MADRAVGIIRGDDDVVPAEIFLERRRRRRRLFRELRVAVLAEELRSRRLGFDKRLDVFRPRRAQPAGYRMGQPS